MTDAYAYIVHACPICGKLMEDLCYHNGEVASVDMSRQQCLGLLGRSIENLEAELCEFRKQRDKLANDLPAEWNGRCP